MLKKSEATEAMDMTPHKVDTAEEGAVGERWKKTQIHIRWCGCAIIKTLIVMK